MLSDHITTTQALKMVITPEWLSHMAGYVARVLLICALVGGWTAAGCLLVERAEIRSNNITMSKRLDQMVYLHDRCQDALTHSETLRLTK